MMRAPILLSLLVLAACGQDKQDPKGGGAPVADLGLVEGFSATLVKDGLQNPSGVSFSPSGELTICDSGHGKVLVRRGDEFVEHITGFPTEYWKVGKDGAPNRFILGCLNAVWINAETLAVSNSGLADSKDHILFCTGKGSAADGKATNGIPPTSDDKADKGEGNPTGLCVSMDGKSIYMAGQGADAKSWILRADIEGKKLEPFLSADDNGISTNSPMQCIQWDEKNLLVLYSGKGGAEDGLLVRWDLETKKPTAQWKLDGLVDPMGMARVGKSNVLAVVDNNWSLTSVQNGKLARVTLDGDKAKVEVLATKLKGPVSCAFGPDGALYVAQLGPEFDKKKGSVLAITGF